MKRNYIFDFVCIKRSYTNFMRDSVSLFVFISVFLFSQAVGRTYSGLQTLPEKSAMVAKTLEYLGDVLKYVKPYLKMKGPPEGLQLTYWIIGNYFATSFLLVT